MNQMFQKQCIDFAINARPACRYMPKNRFSIKYRIWKLVISQPFDWFIMFMIALNTLILMMKVRTATRHSVVEYGPPFYVDYIAVAEWLAVSMLDSGAEGPGFKSQPRRCRVTVLGQLFTPIVPLFTKQQNW